MDENIKFLSNVKVISNIWQTSGLTRTQIITELIRGMKSSDVDNKIRKLSKLAVQQLKNDMLLEDD